MLKLPFSSQMSLLCFLFVFYKEGFMMYAGMELKYRSCVLIYLLPWYVQRKDNANF